MDLGRLAPASEVTESEDISYNGIVCPPATSETGARGPSSIIGMNTKKDNFCHMTPILKCKTVKNHIAYFEVTDFGYPRACRFRKYQNLNRSPCLLLPTFFKT
jgi:hypothetical protein